MYRFICLLTVLISMFLRLPAQEHAVFLGLPLGGNVEEFVEELQDKGYEVRIRSQNIISLTGMFDGVQCIIEVHHTPKSLVVHQVSVAFAEFMENDIARMLKYRQIRKTLKKQYSKWRMVITFRANITRHEAFRGAGLQDSVRMVARSRRVGEGQSRGIMMLAEN